MLRNKKGIGGLEVLWLSVVTVTMIVSAISSKIADIHHKQRAKKQETVEGLAEYPIVVKEEPHMTKYGWSTALTNQ